MNHNDAVRTAAALAMALMLMGAGAGGATATVNSVDTSTADNTSTTSEVQTHTTIEMNNTTGERTYQVITTNDSVPITKVVDNGTGFIAAENTTMGNVSTAPNTDGSHWNATFKESSLKDVEHTIGENVTVEFRAYNNSTSDFADLNTTAYLNFTNSTTLQNIDDQDVRKENVVTVTNDTGPFGLTISAFGETTADVEEERSVNGSSTDVIIAFSNESAKEMFDESASEASSGDKLSKLWKGTRTVATVSDGDTTVPVPVYHEEAPDDVEESSTYAVYKDVGGTQSLVVNLGDSFEDSDEVSVNAIGSAGASTMFLKYISATSGSSMINTGAMLGMVPIVAGRRHRSGPTQAAA